MDITWNTKCTRKNWGNCEIKTGNPKMHQTWNPFNSNKARSQRNRNRETERCNETSGTSVRLGNTTWRDHTETETRNLWWEKEEDLPRFLGFGFLNSCLIVLQFSEEDRILTNWKKKKGKEKVGSFYYRFRCVWIAKTRHYCSSSSSPSLSLFSSSFNCFLFSLSPFSAILCYNILFRGLGPPFNMKLILFSY